MKIFLILILMISCGDEESKDISTDSNSQNNSSESFECIEDSDCNAEDSEFQLHPGGFEKILCIEGSCFECFNNSDCGVGAFCHPGGYCNKID